VEEPVKIVDKKEQVLHTKTIPIVKVLWRNHGVEEASSKAPSMDVQLVCDREILFSPTVP
jgi:predicted metal-dependent hydrolase